MRKQDAIRMSPSSRRKLRTEAMLQRRFGRNLLSARYDTDGRALVVVIGNPDQRVQIQVIE